MSAAISVKELSAHYRGQETPALHNVSFDIATGSMTAIIGPNGAGKSTLLKCMLGLEKTQTGRISFFGEPHKKALQRIAYVPQRSAIDWNFPISVQDVVLMGAYPKTGWLKKTSAQTKDKAAAIMNNLGVAELAQRPIGALSGGQQQRVFIARALMQDAELLILDEPFAGIDITTEQIIIDILRSLKAQGKTILCVHHNLQNADEIFDEALLINQTLIAHGPIKSTLTDENIKLTYRSARP